MALQAAQWYFENDSVLFVVLLKIWVRENGSFAAACIVWEKRDGGIHCNAAKEFGSVAMQEPAIANLSRLDSEYAGLPHVPPGTNYDRPDFGVAVPMRTPQLVTIRAQPLLQCLNEATAVPIPQIEQVPDLQLDLTEYAQVALTAL